MKSFISVVLLLVMLVLPTQTVAQVSGDPCLSLVPTYADSYLRLGRGMVYDLALSPDDVTLAVASASGIYLYAAENLSTQAEFHAEPDANAVNDGLLDQAPIPTTLDWSPDGKQLAVGYYDGVRIWEVSTGQVVVHYPDMADVSHVAWSPDGARLAVINLAQYELVPIYDLHIIEIARGAITIIEEGIIRNADQAVWSPDSTRLLYITSYLYEPETPMPDAVPALGAAVIWNAVENQQETITPTDPQGFFHVQSVAWSPDGKTIALSIDPSDANAFDSHIEFWDAETLEGIIRLTKTSDHMMWSDDGSRFIVQTDTVALELMEGDLVGPNVSTVEAEVLEFELTQNGGLAFIFSRLQLGMFDTQSGQQIAAIRDHTPFILQTAWSPDGERLALVQELGEPDLYLVHVVDAKGGFLADSLIEGGPLREMAWSPTDTRLAIAIYDGIQIFDISLPGIPLLQVPIREVGQLAWSPDGTQLAVMADSGEVTVIELASGAVVATYPSPVENLRSTGNNLDNRLVWTADGLRWIINDWEDTVRVYGPDGDATVVQAEIGVLEVISLGTAPEFLSDGNVVYVPYEGDITFFDVATNAITAQYGGTGGWSNVRWSPGGACYMLATGGYASIVNAADGSRVNGLYLPGAAQTGLYGGVFMSPTGTHVAIPLEDGSVILWGVAE